MSHGQIRNVLEQVAAGAISPGQGRERIAELQEGIAAGDNGPIAGSSSHPLHLGTARTEMLHTPTALREPEDSVAVGDSSEPQGAKHSVTCRNPTESRALILSQPGSIADLCIRTAGTNAPLGTSEVRIDVRAFSLNFGDLLCIKGLYPTMPDYPFTPGFEVSGRVRDVGAKVTRTQRGEDVIAFMGSRLGAHAEVAITDERFVVAKPPGTSHEEACALPVVYMTMRHVWSRLALAPSERILIQSAAGGTGLIAMQMARRSGAEIFATAGSPEKLRFLTERGAHHAIDYRGEDFEARVFELTSGRGVDVVINTLAGEAMQKGINLLAPHGRYVELAMTGLKSSGALDLSRLVSNQSFFSIDTRRLFLERPELATDYLEQLARQLEAGELSSIVGRAFSFGEVREAYRHLESRNSVGKVVVTVPAGTPAAYADPTAAAPHTSPRATTNGPPSTSSDDSSPEKESIAVIGMAGRFPDSRTVHELWTNLESGHCAIAEVPPHRWNIDAVYDPDTRKPGTTNCRRGGFLDSIDAFDPLFFGISASEAEQTDPQQRLFLEEAWNALEDAGYATEEIGGKACGVFVGAVEGDYIDRMRNAGARCAPQSYWGNHNAVLSSRIAYFLDLKGPSVTIDTACSSSLVAIHLACQSLLAGDCELAIAGGVFLTTTPQFFIASGNAAMLSPNGVCSAFDQAANGFVPGEAAAAVVLKPLSAALRDGDTIHGVIKAAVVNQDGRTNGITAPSTLSQTALELAAFAKAGISPETISYIETHGTGTKLGDPIEVQALTNAFRKHTSRRQFCAIGSIKTNIGHAATAAGIASLIKVLLCLKHRKLPPSLNFRNANEHIQFDDTPFFVNKTLRAWDSDDARPRRAALSSFGFSGTNAHLIIEQAPSHEQTAPGPSVDSWHILPVAAHDRDGVIARWKDISQWYDREGKSTRLEDLAFTLQLGRWHFATRSALLVRSHGDLAQKLQQLAAGSKPADWVETDDGPSPSPTQLEMALESWSTSRSDASGQLVALRSIATQYVAGLDPEWRRIASCPPRRIPLPTYPFARDSFWFETSATEAVSSHPLIHDARYTANAATFTTQWHGSEYFLTDHMVHGHCVLPGVTYLELAHAMAKLIVGGSVVRLEALSWSKPFTVDGPSELRFIFTRKGAGWSYHAESGTAEDKLIHHRGRFETAASWSPETSDLAAIRARCPHEQDATAMYTHVLNLGLHLGPALRVVRRKWVGRGELFAEIELPPELIARGEPYTMHPSLLDGALQSTLTSLLGPNKEVLHVPFAMDAVSVALPLPNVAFVHAVELSSSSEEISRFEIRILDPQGRVAVKLDNLMARPFRAADAATSEPSVTVFHPLWRPSSIAARPLQPGIHVVLDQSRELVDALRSGGATRVLRVDFGTQLSISKDTWQIRPDSSEDFEQLLAAEAGSGLCHIWHLWDHAAGAGPFAVAGAIARAALRQRGAQSVIITRVAPELDDGTAAPEDAALAGFYGSIEREDSRIRGRVIRTTQNLFGKSRAQALLAEAAANDRYVYLSTQGRNALSFEQLTAANAPFAPPTGAVVISGGTGALGLLVAERLATLDCTNLVLLARSGIDSIRRARIAALERIGAKVLVLRCDIGRREDVAEALREARSGFRQIGGVIHAAGQVRDGWWNNRKAADTAAVVGSKIDGARYLDELTRDDQLSFFVSFSSLSATVGSAGQSDYAYANSWLDAFTEARTIRRARGECFGRSVSIAWPLWSESAVGSDSRTREHLAHTYGMRPLRTEAGLALFQSALCSTTPRLVVFSGQRSRAQLEMKAAKSFSPSADHAGPTQRGPQTATASASPATAQLHHGASVVSSDETYQSVRQQLLAMTASVLRFPTSRIRTDRRLGDLGFDSLTFTDLSTRLNEQFGLALTPALFFEHPTIDAVTAVLMQRHGTALNDWAARMATSAPQASAAEAGPPTAATVSPPLVPPTANFSPFAELLPEQGASLVRPKTHEPAEPIAIVGISARMPQSNGIDEFWSHLAAGRDLVSDIPADRWDWHAFDGQPVRGVNRTRVHRAAFLHDVDKFDPLFFGISPNEAEQMDPQQRLVLEAVWTAIEDAGYRASDLAGSKTAVFMGVSTWDYTDVVHRAAATVEAQHAPGLSRAMLVNRVSYLLDLRGPSEPVDTACSSALVAIHRAMAAIRTGECDAAIAGGVNVIASPSFFISFDKAGMLSADGSCKTFDRSANGYARGEGVGAFLLKALTKAQADGDHIYGIIRGSATNHGGRTNSLTAPNPNAQAEVIVAACRSAAIDPATITYIEAHGTGTPLGDPIEIEGLKQAFGTLFADSGRPMPIEPYCALGSVKTNVGHLETAAGVAGLLKVLLGMKHGIIPATLHFEELNPYIQITESPFFIAATAQPWGRLSDAEGAELPRRAGISSFGFGGANAHMIVEEVRSTQQMAFADAPTKQLFVLSAKSDGQLLAYASTLADWIEQTTVAPSGPSWSEVAFTLQLGREPFSQRLAIVASTPAELVARLRHFASAPVPAPGDSIFYYGENDEIAPAMRGIPATDESELPPVSESSLTAIAQLWTRGATFRFERLHPTRPNRTPLPTYPFARDRCWIEPPPASGTNGAFDLRRVSDVGDAAIFEADIRANDEIFAHHRVSGQAILPAAAVLELARASGEWLLDSNQIAIGDVLLGAPVVSSGSVNSLRLQLRPGAGAFSFELRSNENDSRVHAQGIVTRLASAEPLGRVSLPPGFQAWPAQTCSEIYARFAELGFEYGSSLRVIQRLWHRADETVALIELPKQLQSKPHSPGWNPYLLDGAIQALVGILGKDAGNEAFVPRGVGQAVGHARWPSSVYAHVRRTATNGKSHARTFDIAITDHAGQALAKVKGLVAVRARREAAWGEAVLVWHATWDAAPAPLDARTPTDQVVLVVGDDLRAELSSRIGGEAWPTAVPRGAFLQSSARSFELAVNERDSWAAVLRACAGANITLGAIVVDARRLDCQQVPTIALSLTQAVVALRDRALPELVFLHQTATPSALAAEGLAAFSRTARIENPRLSIRAVTVTANDADPLALALAELGAESDSIRYDSGRRFIKHWRESAPLAEAPTLRMTAVHLLTGGIGRVGLLVAEHLAQMGAQVLVLADHAPPSATQLARFAAIERLGAKVHFELCNVAERREVDGLISVCKRFGELRGVWHLAGARRDSFLLNKTREQLSEVVDAKAIGALHLDEATVGEPLDWFILFSSIAAAHGNPGQADYAYANALLEALAERRESQRLLGVRRGRSVAIAWPLWKEGGMFVDEASKARLESSSGWRAIPTQKALRALDDALSLECAQTMVLFGEERRMRAALRSATTLAPTSMPSVPIASEPTCADTASAPALLHQAESYLRELLSGILKLPPSRIRPNAPLETYGIDSVMVMELNRELELAFGPLSKTLFFEYQTLSELAGYFVAHQREAIVAKLKAISPTSAVMPAATPLQAEATAPQQLNGSALTDTVRASSPSAEAERDERIAIIGLSGRYPQAATLISLWENLRQGRDSITEIPESRWAHDVYFDSNRNALGKAYSKWGGFLDDVDKFDPFFFNISPREAELMDPQERLFLQTVWHTLEDAGYTREQLHGIRTGVYVGVMYGQYQLLGADAAHQAKGEVPASSFASIANRTSYTFRFEGPSLALDTMCSSSLTAIHLACESLRRGECDAAIAGGVNLTVHPNKYLILSQGGFASSDGRCRSFGDGGDGYVPGEGVGAVMLKRLSTAITDHDRILAVIRGTAINHGGKTNGYTVPNPRAQTRVVADALAQSGVDPRTIGYIEAHGTGTSLGDPIEIAGLMSVYQPLGIGSKTIPIGSIKSNIGHLESAAGIAAVTKVLLQFEHGQIAPSVHSSDLNPNIDFDRTPFFVPQTSLPWPRIRAEGTELPRRATVSSFGAGGSNAHLVLEEFIDERRETSSPETAELLVLSARTEERLRAYARLMAERLQTGSPHIADVATTLRVGREPMAERLAIVTESCRSAAEALKRFADGDSPTGSFFRGTVDAAAQLDDSDESARGLEPSAGLPALAQAWVNGASLSGASLDQGTLCRRISLPGYPFVPRRCWVSSTPESAPSPSAEASLTQQPFGPLLDRWVPAESLGQGIVFAKRLARALALVSDHVVNDRPIFPGAATLEMAAEAAAVLGHSSIELFDIRWMHPIDTTDEPELQIRIAEADEFTRFTLTLGSDSAHGHRSLAEGKLRSARDLSSETVDISACQARAAWSLGHDEFYDRLRNRGLNYGPTFRTVQQIWGNEEEALARLHVVAGAWTLGPAHLDGGLQTTAMIGDGLVEGALRLPFAVDSVRVCASLPGEVFAHARRVDAGRYDILIVDSSGRGLATMNGVSLLATRKPLPITYAPTWQVAPLPSLASAPAGGNVLVVAPRNASEWERAVLHAERLAQVFCLRLGTNDSSDSTNAWTLDASDASALSARIGTLPPLDRIYFFGEMNPSRAETAASLEGSQQRGVLSLFRVVKALLARAESQIWLGVITMRGHAVGTPATVNPPAAAILGLAKTVGRELLNWSVQAIDIDESTPVESIARLQTEPQQSRGEDIAWRRGWRFSRTLAPAPLAPQPFAFRHRGVYLIIGGAGGIGMVLAEHLARRAQARMVLVGRSALSDAQKAKIESIESLKAEIAYVRGDAREAATITCAIAEAKRRWGTLHGVVHSALVLDDHTLVRMSEDTFRTVLDAKAQSLWALAKGVENEALDFALLFSSAQSFAGSAGQGNYTAACAFKDAFACAWSTEVSYPVKVVNWGYWGSVGVVATPEYRQRLLAQGIESIEPTVGMAAIETLLSHRFSQLAVLQAQRPALEALGVDFSRSINPYPTRPTLLATIETSRMPEADAAIPSFAEALAELEGSARRWLHSQLQQLVFSHAGPSPTAVADLEREAGIIPGMSRLFHALLDATFRDGAIAMQPEGVVVLRAAEPCTIERDRQDIAERHPAIAAHARLIATCLAALADVLSGKRRSTDVLFPGGSPALVEPIYKNNPFADHYNRVTASAVLGAVMERRRHEPSAIVNIIEVGAGTGSTTSFILDAVAPHAAHISYHYTDMSPGFVDRGRRLFGENFHDFHPRTLDIESAEDIDRLPAGSFDIVVASNVLHATGRIDRTLAHLKRLLTDRGLLVINELTSVQDFTTMTFGLLDGWWLSQDASVRLAHSPLLDREGWKTILGATGFRDVRVLGWTGPSQAVQQSVIVAESDGHSLWAAHALHAAPTAQPSPAPRALRLPANVPSIDLLGQVRERIVGHFAAVLKADTQDLDTKANFDTFGVDSILATQLTRSLEADFETLPATLLFEHKTIEALSEFLVRERAQAAARLFEAEGEGQPAVMDASQSAAAHPEKAMAPQPTGDGASLQSDRLAVLQGAATRLPQGATAESEHEDIAIVGLSGRYPLAANLEELWANLQSGRACIREVPSDRWDWRAWYDQTPGQPGKMYSRWGGFLDRIDLFDPYLFHITPLEAEGMDPQGRLFLEVVWETLEDAGYTRQTLPPSRKVGVFVGVMNGGYGRLGAAAAARGQPNAAHSAYWSISNRVSYAFDLQGPSLAVDTACSSALTALHLACESLRRGECEAALAGGVHLIVEPGQYVSLSAMRMLSPGDICRPFGAGADGFVDGEGVGAVLLKPLSRAIVDGDRIYAVIKATGVNAGGKTGGYTVPNPTAQADLIATTLEKSGIDPRTISYVEAHGTGTALGDPIEIAGLSAAFARWTDDRQYCAIGSVKANTGHLESAAGIVGLTKLVLQLQHGMLAPSIHTEELNPKIDFEATPFFVQRQLTPWVRQVAGGTQLPRRAALSSFGAGGANAHVIVEEYVAPEAPIHHDWLPQLFVLSAQTEAQLGAYAASMAKHFDTSPDLTLHGVAWTSQIGREAMSERLAIVARSLNDLAEKLRSWKLQPSRTVFRGHAGVGSSGLQLDGPAASTIVTALAKTRDLETIARLWTTGTEVDWRWLLTDAPPRRVRLPHYPFSRERFWIEIPQDAPAAAAMTAETSDRIQAPHRAPNNGSMSSEPGDRIQARQLTPNAGAMSSEPGDRILPSHHTPDRLTMPLQMSTQESVLIEKFWEDAPLAAPSQGARGTVACLVNDDSAEIALALSRFVPEQRIELLRIDDTGVAERCTAPHVVAILDLIDLRDSQSPSEDTLAHVALYQAIIELAMSTGTRLLHLTHTRPPGDAENASRASSVTAAFVRSFHAEYAQVEALTVDVDCPLLEGPTLVRILSKELQALIGASESSAVSPFEIRWRGDRRLIPRLRRLTPSVQPALVLDPAKAYVVTGGTRGLGAAVAEHWVARGARKLVLLGRQAIAPRSEWERLAALETGHDAEKVRYFRRLEAQGVELLIYTGSLVDEVNLRRFFQTVRATLGPIGGVVHAAGMALNAHPAFVHKPVLDIRTVLEPKVQGTLMLHRLVAEDAPDFFVLFSSLSSLSPILAVGASDYAAANSFLNDFAEHHQGRTSTHFCAIQWGNWRDTGMGVVRSPSYDGLGLLANSTTDGLALLDQAIGCGRPVVAAVVATAGFAEEGLLTERPRRASVATRATLTAPTPRHPSVQLSRNKGGYELKGEARTLNLLRETFSRKLKIPHERLAADVSFDEFGVDSILIAELVKELESDVGRPVEPAIFLEYPTLTQLARHLDGVFTEQDSTLGASESTVVATVAAPFTPTAPPSAPNASPSAPNASPSAPNASPSAPNASPLVSHASPSAPNASPSAPNASPLVSHASPSDFTASKHPEALHGGEPIGRTTRQCRQIAVIGLACHFPGAKDKEAFWSNLASGRCSIQEVPESRWDSTALYDPAGSEGTSIGKWGGFIDDIELFDPEYFHLPEAEAAHIDPLVRQFLETSIECLSDAGYQRDALAKQPVGVFAGSRVSNYSERVRKPLKNSVVGTGQNFIAAHVSNFLDLKGPNLVVDTACSSSLVALHLACQSLISGESEVAFAGGVDILLDETLFVALTQAKALSPDGTCHTFDEKANGFVPGEGCGVVLLKPVERALADGDRIYAVIEGTAVNNDGHTMGITTPNPEAQKEVIRKAISNSGIDGASISYVEMHGTGTMIGDPLELRALTSVLQTFTSELQYCAVGSVKTNIGHLLSAAGIAGFIKVLLAIEHQQLPPTLHCETPNPRFAFANSPVFPVTAKQPWLARHGQRRGAISSFGFGGTNAHVVVAELDQAFQYAPRRQPLPALDYCKRRYWLDRPTTANSATVVDPDLASISDSAITHSDWVPFELMRSIVPSSSGNGKSTLAMDLLGEPSMNDGVHKMAKEPS